MKSFFSFLLVIGVAILAVSAFKEPKHPDYARASVEVREFRALLSHYEIVLNDLVIKEDPYYKMHFASTVRDAQKSIAPILAELHQKIKSRILTFQKSKILIAKISEVVLDLTERLTANLEELSSPYMQEQVKEALAYGRTQIDAKSLRILKYICENPKQCKHIDITEIEI